MKKRTSTTFFLIMDVMIAAVSAVMPFVFRFGIFHVGEQSFFLELALKCLPLDALILVAVNTMFRLYNRVWTYAGVYEIYDCAKSAVVTEAVYITYKMMVGIGMFRSYYPFNFLIMFMLLCASRMLVRFVRDIEKRRNKKGDTHIDSLNTSTRDINYEDLLGRDSVVIKNPELHDYISDKVVMVTGGGGSIGSELCRQIAGNRPKELIILDIYENTTFELETELRRFYPTLQMEVLIASIRDYDRLDSIFREYRPDVIYHAAAHKHVPLMEMSPNEAVKNNCLGTLNLVKLADKYAVKRFVITSTDKAVRPTSVMGATKCICDMIIQVYDNRSQTEFVAVRFGNVLGSNGSVVPMFLKQIDEGGPVTLTHRDITRFFMTIPEAVSLVLTAGLMAKGGEIFILDMGDPVRIYDLACRLIKMKGYEPEKDIRIEVVGLRAGEKLYEELLTDEEALQKTKSEKIYIGKPIKIDEDRFLSELDKLIERAENNEADIRIDLKSICPTYQPKTP